MNLRIALAALAASNASSRSSRQPRREKGRHLRSNGRNLHSHLSPYKSPAHNTPRHKSKLARDDHGERDAYIPVSERAGDGTSYEYSQTVDGVDVNVSVNVNVEVNTGAAPPPAPAECLKWDISYETEYKNQYFKYQYYSSKSGKSSKSGSKSSKSGGKSGKSTGKSDKIMMKQVAVKKEVKTCIETKPPISTIAPSAYVTESPSLSPVVEIKTPSPVAQSRPTPIPTMMNITPDPVGDTPAPSNSEDTPAPTSLGSMIPKPTPIPAIETESPTSEDATPAPVESLPPVSSTGAPTTFLEPGTASPVSPTEPPISTPQPSSPPGATSAPTESSVSTPEPSSPGSTTAPQSVSIPTLPPQAATVPTPQPVVSLPTLPPVSTSLVPTVAGTGELSWDFDNGVFPISPWTTDGDDVWAIDQSQVADGSTYSIKSPDLESSYVDGSGMLESNATLTLDDSFGGGVLTFQALASVQPPRDIFVLYIDDLDSAQLVNSQEFNAVSLEVSPGPHTITFNYKYNPLGIPVLPQSPPERLGATWIDSVVIESGTISAPPQTVSLPTLPPATTTSPPQPGGLPTMPPAQMSGQPISSSLQPTNPPQSGSLPTMPPALMSGQPISSSLQPTNPPQSGSLPTMPPALMSGQPISSSLQPTNPPQSGSLPTMPPVSTSLPPVSLSTAPTVVNVTESATPSISGSSLPPVVGSSPPQSATVPTPMPSNNAPPSSSLPPGTSAPSIESVNVQTWDFDSGIFPEAPWTTSGDNGLWAIDQTKVADGSVYSIKSPDLESAYVGGLGTIMSNATLTLDDSFSGGVLKFKALASVQPPRDIFEVTIDGESAAQVVGTQEFSDVVLGVSPGPHVIHFSYQYNPFNIPLLPDSPPERLGATWIDTVTIETLAEAPPGDSASTTPGSPTVAPSYYPSYLPSANPAAGV